MVDPLSTFHSCFLDMLPDNASRTRRLQHAHRGKANRGAIGIEVQSNRGYPVDNLVIGIIILDRCNFDTARKSQPTLQQNHGAKPGIIKGRNAARPGRHGLAPTRWRDAIDPKR